MPAGSGFQKVAAAVKLVKSLSLLVGKTFNSQAGGMVSDALFHNGTLADYEGASAVVPSAASGGHGFDFAMVETWYPHPLNATPESRPYTTAYTAREVMRRFRRVGESGSAGTPSAEAVQ